MKWVAISLVLLAFLCMPSKSQNDTTTSPPTNQTTLNTTTPVPTDATNTTNSTTSDTESLLAAVSEICLIFKRKNQRREKIIQFWGI